MLEIFGIIFLANKNGKNASDRGRKPGSFKGLTFLLWFGCELIGFFTGMAATNGETLSAYGVAILFAIIGGIISYIIAVNCKPGNYQEQQHAPLPNAQPLEVPCAITITRENSMIGAIVQYSIMINGQHAGYVKNGESIRITTSLMQNVIVAKDAYGTEIKPLFFSAPSGGNVWIVFNSQRFETQKCEGIALLNDIEITTFSQKTNSQISGGSPIRASNPQANLQYGNPLQSVSSVSIERPKRAIWLMFSVLAFILLSLFATAFLIMISSDQTYLMIYNRSYVISFRLLKYSYPLLRGICIYLLIQNDVILKIISCIGLLFGSMIHIFSIYYYALYARIMKLPTIEDFIRDPEFIRSLLLTAVLPSFIIAVVTSIFAIIQKRNKEKNIILIAGIIAAVLFFWNLFHSHFDIFFHTDPNFTFIQRISQLVSLIANAICLILFARIAGMVCTCNEKILKTSVGAKIWFILCIVATSGSIIFNFAFGSMNMDFIRIIIALVGIIAMILLLMSKRVGFPLTLIVVILNVAASVDAGLTGVQVSVLAILFSLVGLVNPLITWLLIREK